MEKIESLNEELYGKYSNWKELPALLDHLSQEQRGKFFAFKESLNSKEWVKQLNPDEKLYLSDERNILRPLEGYGWNLETAERALQKISAWREKMRPQDIRMKDLKYIGQYNLIRHFGFDCQCRPILYINATHMGVHGYSEESMELKYKYLLYGIETCLRRMPPNQLRITWIFDMRNAPLSIALVVKMRSMFEQLGDYYPEILNVNIICNVSWTLSFVWRVVKTFIAEHVLLRYFVFRQNDSDPSELQNFLDKYIDKSVLLKSMGGMADDTFDQAKILQLEEMLEAESQGIVSSASGEFNIKDKDELNLKDTDELKVQE